MATLPPSDNPRDHYDFAYGYVLRKDYALAEDGFRIFCDVFRAIGSSPKRSIGWAKACSSASVTATRLKPS